MALRPLVAIFGTTGVGKSNLAIDIALHISNAQQKPNNRWRGARIINADSMQVYAGLDVLTNKVPESERRGVEHLLMGFKQPAEQYVVGQWIKDATALIEETHERGEVPIVVGGTSYWMQHLIFPDRLSGPSIETQANQSVTVVEAIASLPPNLQNLFEGLPDQPPDAAVDPAGASALHTLLRHLDYSMADRWHWRDTRKVLRSLRIVHDTGRIPSEIVRDQSKQVLKPRYDTLCLWLYAEPSVLHARLDDRVDLMLKNGLLDEVRSLHSVPEADFTLGIYQSIGYREFHSYLSEPALPQDAFEKAVESMKTSTRQYAKRQLSWMRNKLLPAVNSTHVPTYLLDATELGQKWIVNVQDPAVKITSDFLNETALPDPATLSPLAKTLLQGNQAKFVDPTSVLKAQRKIICESCTSDPSQPVLIDENRFPLHLQARSHRRLAKKKRTPEQHRAAQAAKRAETTESSTRLEPSLNFDIGPVDV